VTHPLLLNTYAFPSFGDSCTFRLKRLVDAGLRPHTPLHLFPGWKSSMTDIPTSGPRPLQLVASGSIINPHNNSIVPPSSPNVSGLSPAGAEQTETNMEQMESEDLHKKPLLHTPPSSARAMRRSSSRRHSSISYIRSGPNSPFRESFRQEFLDASLKAPLPETFSHLSSVEQRSPGSLLSQNNTLSGNFPRIVKDRRSSIRTIDGSLLGDSRMVDVTKHLKERPPVTMAEKCLCFLPILFYLS
jgi:hypothetical protein